MAQEPADAELMQRAGSGDADAFALIYDRHAPVLLATARRMLGPDDAPDLLHDVFLEAWRHVREYDPSRASVRTWLLVRLRSRALDRRARAARGIAAHGTHASEASVVLAGTDAERTLAIARAFGEIDGDVREVLELTYYEGLTATELAQRTQIPVGTVRSRLARGLAHLRHILAKESEEHD